MAVLQGFPMVSQLTTVTSDGRPSEDAQFDCVPASIGAGILWYEGKAQWDASINPDMLKDAAYGENWKNDGTAAVRFLPVLAKLGYTLQAVNGVPADLATKAHQFITDQKPVIFTEPDPYVSSELGWTHVCVFFAEESGYLTALDPYIAKPIRRTDKEWAELLLNNQIWILEKLQNGGEEDVIIDLSIPIIAQHFQTSGSAWLCKSTSKNIHGLILQYYQSNGLKPYCGYSQLGAPLSNEIPLDNQGTVKQHFERGVLVYDPHDKYGAPSGSGQVYPLQLYNGGPGTDPALKDAQIDPQASQALTVVRNIKKEVAPF